MLSTPWGKADYQVKICTGFYYVQTPSHGGFMITDKAFHKLGFNPVALDYHPYGGDWNGYHCYEEDCEALIILFALSIHQPTLFHKLSNPLNPTRIFIRPLLQENLIQSVARIAPGYLRAIGY